MSLGSLGFSTFGGFKAPVSRFESATPVSKEQESHHAAHDHRTQQAFRESSLVSALMTAFQALGVASASSNEVVPSTDTVMDAASETGAPAVSGEPSVSDVPTTRTGPSVGGDTADVGAEPMAATVAGSTTSVGSPVAGDTLENAVNVFAHALYSVVSSRGQEQHEHHGGGHHMRGSGYNGLTQRLERLAQSLGTSGASTAGENAGSTASSAGTSTATATTDTSSTVTPDSASTPTATATNHHRGLDRLLAAFTQVMSLLQPTSTTQSASPEDTSTSATPSATSTTGDSMTAKLQLFLHTLSQALQPSRAGGSPFVKGSQLNLMV